MNFRIVLHLLRGNWRGLRALILSFWGLLLLAAWFPLSYSPGTFENPPVTRLGIPGLSERWGYPPMSEFDSTFDQWIQMLVLWALVFVSISLAGMLGCHGRDRTLARPVRKREGWLAGLLAFLLFLILPLLAVLAVIPLAQGLGAGAAWQAVWQSTPTLTAKLGAVCLFGTVCGTWWRFAGGVMALYVTGMILPLVGFYLVTPYWMGHPFLVEDSFLLLQVLPALACALVLLLSSRFMRPRRRMALAIAVMLLSLLSTRFLYRQGWMAYAAPAPANLADWSGKVRPVFAAKEYSGELQEHNNGQQTTSYLNLETPWQSEGLPEGMFADWARSGKAELISQGEVVARSPARPGHYYSMVEDFMRRADSETLAKALGKDGKPAVFNRGLAGGGHSYGGEIPGSDTMTAVEPGRHQDTRLVTELGGVAYRFERIVDLPLAGPVEVNVDGYRLHIRRLDHVTAGPMADVAYVIPGGKMSPMYAYATPDLAWIPLFYLPAYDEYVSLGERFQKREVLAPGIAGVRRIFTMGWSSREPLGKQDLAGMRFILLRRVDVARMKENFHGRPAPLVVKGTATEDRRYFTLRHQGEGPASRPRPDPATATDQQLSDWVEHIDGIYDHGDHKARDLTEFIPRQLPTLLAQPNAWSRGEWFVSNAVALGCPESRRGEVIAALNNRPNGEQNNWIPDVIMSRGWTDEAAPQIRELAATTPIKQNYLAQMLIASIEDPQTYPALLQDTSSWIGWPDFYQITRRVPGIEPELSKTIERTYQEAAQRNFRRPGRIYGGAPRELQPGLGDKFYYCLVPAAHGMPDAFAKLLETWQAFNESEKRRHGHMIRDAILLPGDTYDSKSVIKALAAREPSDFRYDTLARLWVPVEEPKP